jgi:hypothetical protein
MAELDEPCDLRHIAYAKDATDFVESLERPNQRRKDR